eukprot:2303089-Rhodomonas_salina.2
MKYLYGPGESHRALVLTDGTGRDRCCAFVVLKCQAVVLMKWTTVPSCGTDEVYCGIDEVYGLVGAMRAAVAAAVHRSQRPALQQVHRQKGPFRLPPAQTPNFLWCADGAN